MNYHKYHYGYIKNKYGNKSRLLFTDTDSLVYEIETENNYGDVSKNKEMLDFRNYSAKSKYCHNLSMLVVAKIKDGTGGVAIVEFVEHKKSRGVNKNDVAKISHNEYNSN